MHTWGLNHSLLYWIPQLCMQAHTRGGVRGVGSNTPPHKIWATPLACMHCMRWPSPSATWLTEMASRYRPRKRKLTVPQMAVLLIFEWLPPLQTPSLTPEDGSDSSTSSNSTVIDPTHDRHTGHVSDHDRVVILGSLQILVEMTMLVQPSILLYSLIVTISMIWGWYLGNQWLKVRYPELFLVLHQDKCTLC